MTTPQTPAQLPPQPTGLHTHAGHVALREITAETVTSVLNLRVQAGQENFVASNAVSLAQALFAPQAWYRAITLDDIPVGFVMLEDDTLLPVPPLKPSIGVWRLMVDARVQGQGVGRAALCLVIDQVRARQVFGRLTLSYVPGPGCPEPFYRALGFVPTGVLHGQEVELALALDGAAAP